MCVRDGDHECNHPGEPEVEVPPSEEALRHAAQLLWPELHWKAVKLTSALFPQQDLDRLHRIARVLDAAKVDHDARLRAAESALASMKAERDGLKDVIAEEVGTNMRIAQRCGFWHLIEAGESYEAAEIETFDALRADLSAARQEREKLEKALLKYGKHEDDCWYAGKLRGTLHWPKPKPCSCGLDAALPSSGATPNTEEG
jgi:hypothetical protein